MAYVDENTVAAHLTVVAASTDLEFKVVEAEHEGEDSDVEIYRGGVKLPFTFQVGGGYVVLNQYSYRDGSLYGLRQLGEWGVQPDDFAQFFPALQVALEQQKS